MRLDRGKVIALMRKQGIRWMYELASTLNVAPQTMSSWWHGQMPEWSTLAALCGVLDCTLDDIIVQPAKADATSRTG